MPKRPYAATAAEALYESVIGLNEREAAEAIKRFIAILKERNRLSLLPNIVKAYARVAAARADLVQVTTAEAMSDAAMKALTKALKETAGEDAEVAFATDPALIAGAVIRHGEMLLDASVQHKLASLKRSMTA